MFGTALSKPHSVRKRMLSNIYAKSVLQSSLAIADITEEVIRKRMLSELAKAAVLSENEHGSKGTVDVFQFFIGVAMDFVTCYQFGTSVGTNFVQHPDVCKHFKELFHGRHSYEFYRQEIPRFSNVLETIGVPLVPKFVGDSNDELEANCLDMCDAASKIVDKEQESGSQLDGGQHPTVYAQLRSSLLATASPETKTTVDAAQRYTIASEMLDHLAAGFDTSSITLTYAVWELSRNMSLQSDLRTELRSIDRPVFPPPIRQDIAASSPTSTGIDGDEIDHRAIDSLPLLHAITMETLRLHPAIPGPQPRITPQNGCTLGQYANIPAGVRVSAQAYSLHRNEDVFPDAESWKPERWLVDDKDKTAKLKEMNRWFWAFGSGGRMCVGSNLAMLRKSADIIRFAATLHLLGIRNRYGSTR
jgi:hypothetical protein